MARTGFRRSLVEALAAATLLTLLGYPVGWSGSTALTGLLAIALLLVYAAAAWRLGPGIGGIGRRSARVAVWTTLFAILSTLVDLAILEIAPYPLPFTGGNQLAPLLATTALLTTIVFLPARALINIWAGRHTHLRWRLTLSYVLVSSLAAVVVYAVLGLYIGLISLIQAPPLIEPSRAAERAARALAPAMLENGEREQSQLLVEALYRGEIRLPVAQGEMLRDAADERPLQGLRRIILLEPSGGVLGSAGLHAPPPGARLPADQELAYALLLAEVDRGGCANARPAQGTLVDSAACGIVDQRGALAATVIVETMAAERSAQIGAAVGRIFGLFATSLAAVLGGLVLASVIMLPLAGGIGYWLARRVTRRLERLAAATSALAAGDLDRQVEVGSEDEIGRLSADFNTMARQLAEREHKLSEAAVRAEALLQANRRLVANVSHELRTPLTTLRGYIETLDQEHGDKLPAHDLAVIEGEVQRLTALIEDLFTLARAEARQLPMSIERVDAGARVRQLVETLRPLARRERQIELVSSLPADLPAVLADPRRLEQILLNLAHNALRYTPPGGIIAFEGAADDRSVMITVADTGVGIPAEEQALVFERFYRGDSSRTRETGGAGLGLALVRELVEAMGGSVAAESTPGRGSRFQVRLPRAEQESHGRPIGMPAGAETSHDDARMLARS